jgi:DNA processing protein
VPVASLELRDLRIRELSVAPVPAGEPRRLGVPLGAAWPARHLADLRELIAGVAVHHDEAGWREETCDVQPPGRDRLVDQQVLRSDIRRGGIETGTVAALAGGLDKPYPPENDELFREIGERGVVVSEMPFGWVPRARDFPRRNRIVAGLAYGLLVVEAAFRSGSLISARLANEFGRLVFAVPGSPLDPRAAGANKLLKDGAILVTETSDILEAVAPLIGQPLPRADTMEEPPDLGEMPPPGDDERSRVVEALGPTPVSVDDIIRHTGLHPSHVFLVLLELDLAGRLERHSGGSVSLLPVG